MINENILLPFVVFVASTVISGSVIGGIAIGIATAMVIEGGKQHG